MNKQSKEPPTSLILTSDGSGLTPYHLGAFLLMALCYFCLKYMGLFKGLVWISPEVISSISLIGILSYGVFGNNRYVDTDKLKFSGLLLLNIFIISFATELIGMLWGLVFFLGFVNTLGIACGLLIMHVYGLLMPIVTMMYSIYNYIKSYVSKTLPNHKGNDRLTSTFDIVYKWLTYLNSNYLMPLGKSCMIHNNNIYSFLYQNSRTAQTEKTVKTKVTQYFFSKMATPTLNPKPNLATLMKLTDQSSKTKLPIEDVIDDLDTDVTDPLDQILDDVIKEMKDGKTIEVTNEEPVEETIDSTNTTDA